MFLSVKMRQRLIGLFLKLRKCAERELWTIRNLSLLVAKRELRLRWFVLLLCLLRDTELDCAIALVLAYHLDKVPGQLTEENFEYIVVLQVAFLVGRLNVRSQGEQVLEVVFAAGTCNSLGKSVGSRLHMLLKSGPVLETLSDRYKSDQQIIFSVCEHGIRNVFTHPFLQRGHLYSFV